MLITCIRCDHQVDTGEAQPGDIVTCGCGLGLMVPEPPAVAGKMNCPACGAPVDPKLARCNFCDTKLATVLCPRCFGAVFTGTDHCCHCGEGLKGRVIHHGDATAFRCPRGCDTELRVEVVAGCPLARCPNCEGLWIDRETVERLYQDKERADPVRAMIKDDPSRQSPVSVKQVANQGYIKCPVCASLMTRKNFARYSGVITDVCPKHGTWFDADELRRVLQFIKDGGLDKAAKRERQNLTEELRYLQVKQGGSFASPTAGPLGDRLTSGRFALGFAGRLLRKLFDLD